MLTLRLLNAFYKSYAFTSLMITLACMSILYTWGIHTITALFWFKLFTLGVTVYFTNSYKWKEFYFYQNLGLSKTILWSSTLLFDFALFVLALIITLKIK